MELEEFEKMIDEQPQEVAADEVKEALQQAEEEQPTGTEPEAEQPTGTEPEAEQPTGTEPEQPEQVTVNMLQFGQIVTNLYCGVSDFVYKKVKKADHAPKWDDETKQTMRESFELVLRQYNVQMTPTTQLLAVLAVVEVTRYSLPLLQPDESKIKFNNEN